MRSEGYRDLVKCPVAIELADGKLLLGVIQRPRSKNLLEYLNTSDPFIELHLFEGPVVQVAKVAMLTCEQRNGGKADHLDAAKRAAEGDNPLAVLGLEGVESKEQIREAYLKRMRLYHSDRYGGIDLPHEVSEYMAHMSKRINAAYRDALTLLERRGKVSA